MLKFLRRHYLLIFFLGLLPLTFGRVNGGLRGVIWSDCEGYYKYLPAVFVLGDVHKMPEGSVWPLKNDQGEYLNKYTCGVAIFEAPFFLVARAYSVRFSSHPEDIFNKDYARSVVVAGFCAAFLGLFFLQSALRRKYSEKVVVWSLMAVFLGTNAFHYATKEMGMAHIYAFFLVAFLMWQTPRFYARPSVINAMMLGAGVGWLTLIRPTNALLLIFVLLYEVYNWAEFKKRLQFLLKNAQLALPFALAGVLFWVPQMLYWHEMTGNWFRYSYTDEHFIYWNRPKIAAVLFDPQNGLFLYSPMVLLMVWALFRNLKERENSAPAILGIMLIATYAFASWWAWWFGGAFGARSYVDLYPLLAFPMASMFQNVFDWKTTWKRSLFLLLACFLMFYSVRMSFLYNILPGPWDGPDWRWNFDKMRWVWKELFHFFR